MILLLQKYSDNVSPCAGLNLGLKCSHECSSLIDFFKSHPYTSVERGDSARMASHCNLTEWKDLKEKITDMAGNSHQRAPWLSDCAADVSSDGRSITADTAEPPTHKHTHTHTPLPLHHFHLLLPWRVQHLSLLCFTGQPSPSSG